MNPAPRGRVLRVAWKCCNIVPLDSGPPHAKYRNIPHDLTNLIAGTVGGAPDVK